MNINERIEQMYFDPNEKPLDRIVTDGGFASIFRSVAFVGDSLSSGEFETVEENGVTHHYYDMFPYSWGQYMARMCGFTAYNFSRGGMTASEYCESFAEAKGFWDKSYNVQAYVIALGVNDLVGARQAVGTLDDINLQDPTQNAKTFVGYYARIIQQYKAIQPDAKFFLVTAPRSIPYETAEGSTNLMDLQAERMHELANLFSNTYVIDLRAYGPVHDEAFVKRFYLYGHMNAMGYRLSAELTASYIDYIVRHHYEDFLNVPFIGSDTPMLC